MSMIVRSEAFRQGQKIPATYTADGDDISPPLSWERAPEGTKEFALVCDDPDAPSPEPWVHWVLYHLPADVTSLPAGVPAASQVDTPISAMQGRNSWTTGQTIGYRGPAPPAGHGVHRYRFTIFALDKHFNLPADPTKTQLLDAIRPHVIATGELVGTYSR